MRPIGVYFHVGNSGSGKSYTYVELVEKYGEENVYVLTDCESGGFDKYCAERILFIDEFRGQIKYHILLNSILSPYKCQVHSRYSNIIGLWGEIHITSVLPPEQLYRKMVDENRELDTLEQLIRRITAVVHHWKTPDGKYHQYEQPIKEYTNYENLELSAGKMKMKISNPNGSAQNVIEKTDAKKVLNRVLNELENGEYIEKSNMLFAEYLEFWLNNMVNYGLRRGEVLGLRWQDIDFESKSIFICNTRIRVKEVIEKQPKSEASLRTLPLIPHIERYLLRLREQQNEDKLLMGKCYTDCDYVCRKRDGTPTNMDSCNGVFKRILRKNNLQDIRLHDLRHCTASFLLKNGASMKEIQIWLGHSDISTTMNIYTHVDYEMKKTTANLMNDMNFEIR